MATTGAVALSLSDLTKTYGSVRALDRLSLEVPEGCFFVLFGPSSVGKTTTLRAISGLVAARQRNYPYWRPGCDERAHSRPRGIDGVSVLRPLSPPQRLQESGVSVGGRRSSARGDRAARRRDRRDAEAFASASAEACDTVGRRAAARRARPFAHPQAEAPASGRTAHQSRRQAQVRYARRAQAAASAVRHDRRLRDSG